MDSFERLIPIANPRRNLKNLELEVLIDDASIRSVAGFTPVVNPAGDAANAGKNVENDLLCAFICKFLSTLRGIPDTGLVQPIDDDYFMSAPGIFIQTRVAKSWSEYRAIEEYSIGPGRCLHAEQRGQVIWIKAMADKIISWWKRIEGDIDMYLSNMAAIHHSSIPANKQFEVAWNNFEKQSSRLIRDRNNAAYDQFYKVSAAYAALLKETDVVEWAMITFVRLLILAITTECGDDLYLSKYYYIRKMFATGDIDIFLRDINDYDHYILDINCVKNRVLMRKIYNGSNCIIRQWFRYLFK